MSPQRYERVAANDDVDSPLTPAVPNSPPPSFRSRPSSPSSRRLLQSQDPLTSEADRALADSFDSPSDDDASDAGENGGDDRRRLIRTRTEGNTEQSPPSVAPRPIERRVTQFPNFAPERSTTLGGRAVGGGSQANDGVFANLNAKPERGEKLEELPPTYEQAAADASPPYWETTILAPGMNTDDVYIQGLPVGSVFSFAWNGMISMSFQLVGFLLTYLLHTTHAAKNGSLAGLGITLVQFGFSMRGSGSRSGEPDGGRGYAGQPPDPNSHDFDPSAAAAAAAMVDAANGNASAASTQVAGFETSDLVAYGLMIFGWLVMIRAVTNFLKARRHEQLVLQSPDRGLGVPVVATGEQSETVV